MLVLERKPLERIRIGRDIEVVVLATGRGKVRLGVVAPKGIAILRDDARKSGPKDLAVEG
jgi:carbon storage regulator